MASFRELHRPGDPFVLPNAWDVGSARALVAAGFPAVGTTSLGIAASAGLADATRAAREANLACARALKAANLGCWLTVDLEDGFSDEPGAVAELVDSLAVAGVNLEDSSAGSLVEPVRHAAKIAAVKQACPDVFVNARTDVFWSGSRSVAESIGRLRAYADAGADGVFLPGDLDLPDVAAVAAGVEAPLNVLASARHTLAQFAEAGVARISTGSLLYRAALTAALDAARAVESGGALPAAMSYAGVQRLHGG